MNVLAREGYELLGGLLDALAGQPLGPTEFYP